jgi:hypothetical protein
MKFGYLNSFDVLTQGFEIRNFINLALYFPWILLFNKGNYITLSQKSKIQNSLFAISMKKFGSFISITNDGIVKKYISRVKEHMLKLW